MHLITLLKYFLYATNTQGDMKVSRIWFFMVTSFFCFFVMILGQFGHILVFRKKKYLKMTNIEEISFIAWKILLSFLDSIFLFAEYLKHQYLSDKIQVEWSYLKKKRNLKIYYISQLQLSGNFFSILKIEKYYGCYQPKTSYNYRDVFCNSPLPIPQKSTILEGVYLFWIKSSIFGFIK